MILDKFRKMLEAWWNETDAREVACKNSQGALLDLITLYERFDPEDRALADQVLSEWITSKNERKRFDALAMVDRFHIRMAELQLRMLESEIMKKQDHEAPFELAKVRRILERFS